LIKSAKSKKNIAKINFRLILKNIHLKKFCEEKFVQTTLEQAIEIVNSLPYEDRENLRKWLDEKDKKTRLSEADIERHKKIDEWLAKNSEKYMNEWVCLDGDKLIAHGKDGREVYKKAIEEGIKTPFLEHIIEEKNPFGGW
jgi:hypothetical protein